MRELSYQEIAYRVAYKIRAKKERNQICKHESCRLCVIIMTDYSWVILIQFMWDLENHITDSDVFDVG